MIDQVQRPEDLDEAGQLDRFALFHPFDGPLGDTRGSGKVGLSEVSVEPATANAFADLGENGQVRLLLRNVHKSPCVASKCPNRHLIRHI